MNTAEDGSTIVRVDNAWQQSKGSKISEDGFHKKDHSTITMPKILISQLQKEIHKAGKFVEELRAAKKRGDKMKQAAEHSAWENRKTQIVIDKKEN